MWHDIAALRKNTRSDDVGRGKPSPPLDSKHSLTASGIKCTHRLWEAHTVERRRAWHAIIALAAHTVERRRAWHPIVAFGLAHTVGGRRMWHAIRDLGRQTRSNDVRLGMTSSPLGSIDGRTASGVACHHRLWTAHTLERRQAWHAIIAFGQHKRSNDVGRGMTSPPLYCMHGRKTSGVA